MKHNHSLESIANIHNYILKCHFFMESLSGKKDQDLQEEFVLITLLTNDEILIVLVLSSFFSKEMESYLLLFICSSCIMK